MSRVEENIKSCQSTLQWWSKNHFQTITQSLNSKKRLLKLIEETAVVSGRIELVLQLKREINDLLSQEEKLWQQRSKTQWMKRAIKTPVIFTVECHIDTEEIRLMVFGMNRGGGEQVMKILQKFLFSTIRGYFP